MNMKVVKVLMVLGMPGAATLIEMMTINRALNSGRQGTSDDNPADHDSSL